MLKRRKNDEEHPDFEDEYVLPGLVGTIQQLTDYPKKIKIKKRPIGFTVNIDKLIEEQ